MSNERNERNERGGEYFCKTRSAMKMAAAMAMPIPMICKGRSRWKIDFATLAISVAWGACNGCFLLVLWRERERGKKESTEKKGKGN